MINQLEAVAFLFEKSHGNRKSEHEEQVIFDSELSSYPTTELERIIMEGFENGLYKTEEERVSVYWSLSKLCRRELILPFKEWLSAELNSNNPNAVYQLLIARENLDEPVFNQNRNGSSAYFEGELNIRDAKEYLK